MTPAQEERREKRERKKVEALFGNTSTSKSLPAKGRSQDRAEGTSEDFSRSLRIFPEPAMHQGVQQQIEDEPFSDEGGARSFQSLPDAFTSSDLIMLSKEAPIIGGRDRKRKRRGLSLQGGAPTRQKKKYEPAYQPYSAKTITSSPVDIIDGLNLSPLHRKEHEIDASTSSGLINSHGLGPLGFRESSIREVKPILFFNDGVQVGEDGIPLHQSTMMLNDYESKVDTLCTLSSSSHAGRSSPFGRSLQDAFDSHYA